MDLCNNLMDDYFQKILRFIHCVLFMGQVTSKYQVDLQGHKNEMNLKML
jgi:hypothetical protein